MPPQRLQGKTHAKSAWRETRFGNFGRKLFAYAAYNVWYDIKGGLCMNENFPILSNFGDIDDYIYADVEITVSER